MKTIIILLSSLLLFSSCYSYKQVNIKPTNLIVKKRYKVKTGSKKFKKIKVVSINDSIVISKINGKTKIIKLSDIKSIKKGKVSVSKTIGMTLLTTLGTSLFLVMTGIGSNGGWIY